MDSDLSSTASSFTDDPTESSGTYEAWTSAGTSSYASAMTSTQDQHLNSTYASFSAMWNSTFTTSADDSDNSASPTEPMVTTGDEPKKRRRKKGTDDNNNNNNNNNSFQSPESLIVSQCDAPLCYCSNLSTTNLEYNIQHGEIAILGFFPIHGTRQDGRFCSEFNRREGFESLMAFKYAIKASQQRHQAPGQHQTWVRISLHLFLNPFHSRSSRGNATLLLLPKNCMKMKIIGRGRILHASLDPALLKNQFNPVVDLRGA